VTKRRHRARAATAASLLVLLVGAAAVVVAGWGPWTTDIHDAAPGTGPVAVAQGLTLITDGGHRDYRRDAFGEAWQDIDDNGCSQRQDVLARDLSDTVRDQCTVLTGTLDDPYTGALIRFAHDRVAAPGEPGSVAVQIDHIVSLAAAWEGGASEWTDDDRVRFANTLDNLLAVDGTANQSKGSKGPGSWLPPDPDFRCDYAQRYAAIAARWRIGVTRADRDALVAVLRHCA
jgi:hypothetical protein